MGEATNTYANTPQECPGCGQVIKGPAFVRHTNACQKFQALARAIRGSDKAHSPKPKREPAPAQPKPATVTTPTGGQAFINSGDVESDAMHLIATTLNGLDTAAQRRVMHYIYHRFDFRAPSNGGGRSRRDFGSSNGHVEAVDRRLRVATPPPGVKPTVSEDTISKLANDMNGHRL